MPQLTDRAWDAARRGPGWQLACRFCTLRNLVVHRGRFTFDAMGFAWGGIYRTLLVTSIVTTSYRNEGHFRAGRRLASQVCTVLYQLAGVTGLGRMPRDLAAHVHRHIDPETREFLFPGGHVPEELERRRLAWIERPRGRQRTLAEIEGSSRARQAIWNRPDVAALLVAGEPLIRQGHPVTEMLVVLSATAPLLVLHAPESGGEPRQVATLAAPTVLGEIGMWRRQPAVATVVSQGPNRLEVLVIDARRFEALQHESGFRAATAAEVQRRLSLNTALVGRLLDDAAARTGDARLASIVQLFRHLTGDSHVPLDRVIDLADDATPAECVEALRTQIDEAIEAGGLPSDLERHLGRIVATIG